MAVMRMDAPILYERPEGSLCYASTDFSRLASKRFVAALRVSPLKFVWRSCGPEEVVSFRSSFAELSPGTSHLLTNDLRARQHSWDDARLAELMGKRYVEICGMTAGTLQRLDDGVNYRRAVCGFGNGLDTGIRCIIVQIPDGHHFYLHTSQTPGDSLRDILSVLGFGGRTLRRQKYSHLRSLSLESMYGCDKP